MKCKDVMKTDVWACHESTTVSRCAQSMRDHNVGFLPVLDDTNRVAGVVTDRDIAIQIVAEDRPLTTPVSVIMSRDLLTCRPADALGAAEKAMSEAQKSRILVIHEDGSCAGVISLSDIGRTENRWRAGQVFQA
ncbi:MAG: CBS domain-containing protein, partial [Bdellovibrionota bacterium]